MKIIIHSMSELYELAAAIYGAKAPERVVGLPAALAAPFVSEPVVSAREEAPQDEPETEGDAAPSVAERASGPPEFDSAGLPWDERIHAPSKATNKDGTWRSRRNVDPGVVAAVEAELRAKLTDRQLADETADEPVATETHALPQGEPESEGAASEPEEAPAQGAPVVEESLPRYTPEELAEHVLVCQEQAPGQSDNHVALLESCKRFIEVYGHAAFNELKAAVAPAEGAPSGKSLQQFDPNERRLMQACMAGY